MSQEQPSLAALPLDGTELGRAALPLAALETTEVPRAKKILKTRLRGFVGMFSFQEWSILERVKCASKDLMPLGGPDVIVPL